MTDAGHEPTQPTINVNLPRRTSSLGIVSFVLGVLAFSVSWIPFLGILGTPLSALGLILGGIGFLVALARKGAGIGFPIAGVLVSGLALALALGSTHVLTQVIQDVQNTRASQRQKDEATNQTQVADPSAQTTIPEATEVVAVTKPAQKEKETEAAPAPEKKPNPPEVWAPADKPVRQGDIELTVKSVRIGKIAFKSDFGGEARQSREAYLSIKLEVKNLSDTKKIQYSTWSNHGYDLDRLAKLTDNFNNEYQNIIVGRTENVEGQIFSESLYPQATLSDLVLFEVPVDKADTLKLELPARAFGGEGKLRLQIPTTMIAR